MPLPEGIQEQLQVPMEQVRQRQAENTLLKEQRPADGSAVPPGTAGGSITPAPSGMSAAVTVEPVNVHERYVYVLREHKCPRSSGRRLGLLGPGFDMSSGTMTFEKGVGCNMVGF